MSRRAKVALEIAFEPHSPIFISTKDAGAQELRRVAQELRKRNGAAAENDRAVTKSA